MKTRYKTICTTAIILAALFVSDYCFARAGGGGGTGGAGGGIVTTILAFILAPFLLIYSAIVTILEIY